MATAAIQAKRDGGWRVSLGGFAAGGQGLGALVRTVGEGI
jgi:hypothetical protein